MTNLKGLLLGAVAASVLAAGSLVTPAYAAGHSDDGSAVIGHKKGQFYIKSKDGNYSVLPGMKFQFDYTTTLADETFATGNDTRQFDIPRLHFGVKGRAGSPNLTYGMLFDMGAGGNANNIDAKLTYKFMPEVSVRAGTYKSLGIPAGKRYSSSSGWLVDDPNGVGSSAGDRNFGVSVLGKVAKVVSYEAKLSHGGGRQFETATDAIMWDFGVAYEPFGRYGALNQPDYTAKNNLRVTLGAGYQGAQGATGAGNFNTYAGASTAGAANLSAYHMNVGAKYAGLHLTGTYEHGNYQSGDGNGTQQDGQRSMTYLLAASYMIIPKKVPIAVTYSVTDGDTTQGTVAGSGAVAAAVDGRAVEWGIGVAYLFNGHKNKLHASWDRVTTQNNGDTIDGSADSETAVDTFKLRWQVLF